MSTWQIFSDTGNSYRWEVSGRIIRTKHVDDSTGNPTQENNSGHRLPSMADLLLQSCSKLLENGGKDVENAPMFRTGLGKSVVLKQSSIAKAVSVLGDADTDAFKSGCSKILENGGDDVGNAPMFRTGLGKSVVLKQSSIAKALSVLGGDDDDGINSGEVHTRENVHGFSNSLFHTGSGKSVNISSAGLVRAKMLLGLEEDNDHSNFQGFQNPGKSSTTNEQYGWQNLSHLEMKKDVKNIGIVDGPTSVPRSSLISKTRPVGSKLMNEVNPNLLPYGIHNSATKPPPIKFHTAGGRSLSVSSDALERARSLLGDPDLGTLRNEGDAADPAFSVVKESKFSNASADKEKDFYSAFTYPGAAKSKYVSKNFISPLQSSSKQVQSSFNSENIISGSSLIKKFDAFDDGGVRELNRDIPSIQKPISNGPCAPDTVVGNSWPDDLGLRINPHAKSLQGPLLDISNTIGTAYSNNRQTNNEKRRLGGGSSISPFKRPRSSKFTTPLNRNVSSVPSGLSTLSSENSCYRRTVSSRYPFKVPRMYIKDYVGEAFSNKSMLEHVAGQERWIKPGNADKYMFPNKSGVNCIGPEAFFHMLAQSGASRQNASKEWVTNHYKWIIWKLACYERCHLMKSAGTFFTVSNALEELKYRYEKEINHGHRSSIKRILEGDAPPSSMLVLCISAIYISCESTAETHPVTLNETERNNAAKVELTDGWYSVDALLDVSLSKHLAAGKLFVGQKLRIWGARLCGWVGPVSPLEASRTVSLLLHINGTYRAHWADRLGFCKGVGAPLAFRCIKSNGGPVPQTLVGITRIYPVLYKEKFSNGGSIVRSEGMEAKMVQLYNQRRSAVVESIVSECQRGIKGSHNFNDSDSEEGAKILKLLETAAEPEVLMAEMSSEQLTSFASYQAKLEATKQLDMEKAIEKALQDSGLWAREVIPFMRVRVVGLTNCQGKGIPKEGLITIWNPSEKQQSELVEGQAYCVAGLVPLNSDWNTLYLQARGSTTKWQSLSPQATQHFQPFFSPRVSVFLSNLGDIPLCSEFDVAAFVLYVGEVYTAAEQKKQWVFVTDCSTSMLQSEEISNCLLAISFCSPCMDDDSFTPINHNLAGSTAGFCNLIKRAKDQTNNLWIAEATENSTYHFSFDSQNCSHLRNAAASVQSWAKISSSVNNIEFGIQWLQFDIGSQAAKELECHQLAAVASFIQPDA